jgi:hypothetical protein
MNQRIRIDQDEKPERTLIAYKFDGRTGVWCGTREVRGERYGNGDRVYILKLNETFEEPPDTEAGEVAVFLETTRKWFAVQDHRGETWVDTGGNPQLIGRVGNPAEWGLKQRA